MKPDDVMVTRSDDAPRLRCAGYQGEASVHTKGLRALATALATADPGMTVEVTPDVTAQGHKAAELPGLVERGALELCYFNSSYLAERVPALRALDLPFVITRRERAYALLDGALGAAIGEAIARATGFRLLALWDNGFRHITNRARPIRGPRDCAGLRLRTVDSALHQEIFRALGFEPVVIDVKDLPAAVGSGRVDAQENPLTNTVNFGLHRTHRHISLTAHFFGVALLLANRARFDGWPAATQDAIRAAVAVATAAQRGFATGEDTVCLERLAADGCAIVGPDAIDVAAFDAAVAGIRRRVLADLDPAIAAALEASR
jgi:TRAP-type C4-dicarboxylate transport system substrate-binding protein